MGKQIINLGSGVGTHDGDGARTGGEKINENFTEVYDTIDLLIADSTIYNHITKSNGFSLSGQDLTVNAGWEWLKENIEKTNAANVVVNIPYSASGKSRVEYLVPNASNGFTRIIGIESTSSPVAPLLPNKDMFVTWYIVDDGSIGELSPTITGENYIAKNEKIRLDNINGTGSLADWTIGNERSCFNFSNTVTEFKSFHYASQIYAYDGKIFTFKNSQAGAVTLFHNAGTGLFKFRFPNAANFVLHQYEVVEFRLNYEDTSVPKLEYIGVIASTAFSGTQDDVPDGSVYKQYSATEKNKLADTYIKSEVDAKIASLYKLKGSVANYGALPGSGQVVGDVWNLTDTGANYVWTGTVWDELGTTVDISGKENTSNKTDTVIGNESSSSLFASIKGMVDWVTSLFAPKASPTFTGTPSAPTATVGTNTTQLATTEFVLANVGGARIYNVKDYGAVGNGSTDDTVKIQDTINACFAAGGGVVYFPIGVYIIGGALQNAVGAAGVNYNSQLYIPYEIYTSSTRRTVELLGEVAPNLFQSLGIGSYTAPNSGVILRSTIQGSGTRPSVIANSGLNATGGNGFNYTTSYFKNLSIQITPNGSSKVTIGAINCENAAIANFENVTAFPYNVALPSTGKPDVIDVVGIAMPKINCEHINNLKNCSVGGFTQGYLLGEHTSAYDAVAICCVNGFNQQENYHLGNYEKISAFWCSVDFIVTGTSYFNVMNLQTEWTQASKWYDAVTTLSDVSNYGKGRFNFNIIQASVGFNNDKFTKIGGTSIEVKPISLPALVNAQTGTTYTFKYADAFRLNSFSNAADVTVTIPPNSSVAYDINARILIKRKGAGRVILAAGVGVTFEYPSGYSLEVNAQYDAVELVQESINTWGIFGALKSV